MPTHQLRVCRVKRYCQAAYVSSIYIQRPKYLETADGLVTHSENYGYTYSGKLSTVKAWAHALGFTHPHYSIVRTVLGVVLA